VKGYDCLARQVDWVNILNWTKDGKEQFLMSVSGMVEIPRLQAK
jgi:hypothetical protein